MNNTEQREELRLALKAMQHLKKDYCKTNVTGNEDLALTGMNALKELGVGVLSLTKWLGGGAINVLSKGISVLGKTLTKIFSNNQVLIKQALNALSKDKEVTLKFNARVINTSTSNGNVENLEKDLDNLISFLEEHNKHSKEIQNYLDKQLLIARRLGKVKNTKDILDITEEFDNLAFPTFKAFKDLPGNLEVSQEVKEGKVTYNYATSNNSNSNVATLELSSSDVNRFLTKLNKANGYLFNFKNNYELYESFLKNWNTNVGNVSKNLSSLEGVSGTAMKEAERLLGGDTNSFLFYSGFTPRVVTYLDRYVNVTLSVFT